MYMYKFIKAVIDRFTIPKYSPMQLEVLET